MCIPAERSNAPEPGQPLRRVVRDPALERDCGMERLDNVEPHVSRQGFVVFWRQDRQFVADRLDCVSCVRRANRMPRRRRHSDSNQRTFSSSRCGTLWWATTSGAPGRRRRRSSVNLRRRSSARTKCRVSRQVAASKRAFADALQCCSCSHLPMSDRRGTPKAISGISQRGGCSICPQSPTRRSILNKQGGSAP